MTIKRSLLPQALVVLTVLLVVILLSVFSCSAFCWTSSPLPSPSYSTKQKHHHLNLLVGETSRTPSPTGISLLLTLLASAEGGDDSNEVDDNDGDDGITVQERVDNGENNNGQDEDFDSTKSLMPMPALVSSSTDDDNVQDNMISNERNNNNNNNNNDNNEAKQVLMITQNMKQIMIEELGYKRKEVDSIRVELVPNIIENKIKCPPDGMSQSWFDPQLQESNNNSNNRMLEKLKNESKYPLKFPLLAVSLVLFGKGFSDALITLIKVNMDFPGASLTAQFQGIPILGIDILCVILGSFLGLWTWKTMK